VIPDMPKPTTTPEQRAWLIEEWMGPTMTALVAERLNDIPDALSDDEMFCAGTVMGMHISFPDTARDDQGHPIAFGMPTVAAVKVEAREMASKMTAELKRRPNRAARRRGRHRR